MRTFVANPHYWGAQPVIKTVKFTTVADFNTTLAQLKTGETGMAEGLPMSIQPQLRRRTAVEAAADVRVLRLPVQ